MAGQTCRSSGVLAADKIVSNEQCLLVSIHACETGSSTAEIRVFDGTSAAGTEIARIVLAANQTIEFDMHGVLARNGLFFKKQSGSVACSIEFA
tara:strand:+ start:389 stop:670 length:282 start_codon:yes stop_codon:yes gene_type:complete